jgi:predicted transcriptional regulator YheO
MAEYFPAATEKPKAGSEPLTQKQLHPVLEAIRQIMPGLAKSLGPDCELALHDFEDVSASLVAIEEPVTGRSPGAPLTDLILRILRHNDDPPDLINYHAQTSDGRILRSSTLFIRDSHDDVVGCLCVNRDLTHWILARNVLEDFCQTHPLDDSEPRSQETFVEDVKDVLQGAINEILTQERKPVKLMEKADKVRVVHALDGRGVFLIKGAVEEVASALNVSRYTIYNYLEEGRRLEEEGQASTASREGGS